MLEDADERIAVGTLEYARAHAEFARGFGNVKYANRLDQEVAKLMGETALREELTQREQAYIEKVVCNPDGSISEVCFGMKVRVTYTYGEDAAWYPDYSKVKVDSYDRRDPHQRTADAVFLADILRDAIRVSDVMNKKFPRKSS
jgi:hypothetical protein